MAVQKRRQSKGRSSSRRAQWMKMSPPATNKCPHCGETRLAHQACKACGQYGSTQEPRVVIEKKPEEAPQKQQ